MVSFTISSTFSTLYTIIYCNGIESISGGYFLEKLKQLVGTMKQHQISNMIITDTYSIRYLIGYYTQPGERLLALIATASGDHYLMLNNLFPRADETGNYSVLYYQDGEKIMERIANVLIDGITSIDKFWPSHFLLDLMDIKADLQPVNASYILDDMRAIKSEDEISIMREASKLNDQVMEKLMNALRTGKSEAEYAEQLAGYYKELGHSGFSFDPIVGYGANGADPHHTTDESLPRVGDTIVLDIGGMYKGYASDMTRTVFFGEPHEEAVEVYDVVRRANLAGIAAVKPGVSLSSIDLAARKVITGAGYGEYFTHRLGHFIGQEAHEAGDVSQFNDELTKVGQVFSIEPGVYLPGKFGVRIEDLVVVTEDGCEVLNHVTKEPIIIEVN